MPSALPFEQQPLEAPLNDEAKRKLRELAVKRINDYSLHPRVTKALDLLDKGVGPIIDRVVEEKERHEKRRARLAERGEEPDPNEQERYEAFQNKVEELTKLMDQSIRQVVDTKIWLEELPDALGRVSNSASSQTQSQQSVQRATQQSGILPTMDTSPRPFDPDSGEDGDDQDGQTLHGSSNTQVLPLDKTPSAVLEAALAAQQSSWEAKTLTDKYAHDNDYVGWYTSRWNSLNPGESAPPMPAASVWFAAEEGRGRDGAAVGATARNGHDDSNEEDDDSDIEIEREKISIKCPITLRPFEEPVMSSKCKHSFEKTVILSMLQQSGQRQELGPEQLAELAAIRRPRERAQRREQLLNMQPVGIKCPECRTFFIQQDLRPNPVLKRRVQRQLEWQHRQDERARLRDEADDEDMEAYGDDTEPLRGTQGRPVGLGSSPVQSTAGRRSRFSLQAKEEPKSSNFAADRVPETQQGPGPISQATTTTMDLDDD